MWIIILVVFGVLGAIGLTLSGCYSVGDYIGFSLMGSFFGVFMGGIIWLLVSLILVDIGGFGVQKTHENIPVQPNIELVKMVNQENDPVDAILNGKVVYVIDDTKYNTGTDDYKIVQYTRKGSGLLFPIEEKTVEVTIPTK